MQRLARYLRQLSEIALASLPEAERQQRQLALVNELVALLHQQAPRAVGAGDQLHPSAQLLQEIRAPVAGLGVGVRQRPLIPLADGALLMNAPSEPSVGRALEAEIPSAEWWERAILIMSWADGARMQPCPKKPC